MLAVLTPVVPVLAVLVLVVLVVLAVLILATEKAPRERAARKVSRKSSDVLGSPRKS